ncbi:MAG: hypothetical protein LH470_10070 [Lysobacter sp.]|nr:hypothetical protein [Lysobacter sp.]
MPTTRRLGEAIKAFADTEIARARYYPEDKDFLLEFEPIVQHDEIVEAAEAPFT